MKKQIEGSDAQNATLGGTMYGIFLSIVGLWALSTSHIFLAEILLGAAGLTFLILLAKHSTVIAKVAGVSLGMGIGAIFIILGIGAFFIPFIGLFLGIVLIFIGIIAPLSGLGMNKKSFDRV